MKVSDIEVSYITHAGSDLSVVNAARVSFHKESLEFKDGDKKLINYLAKNRHFSPFNHCFISLRVKAPVFVGRQLVKHKFMPWNEVSRRYVDEEPEFYIPEIRERSSDKKQGSGGKHHQSGAMQFIIKEVCEQAVEEYNFMLEEGVAPEIARSILPQNMMSEWYWSGTLGAYADMLKLRLDEHTQYESQIVAKKVLEIVQPLFPVSVAALLEIQ